MGTRFLAATLPIPSISTSSITVRYASASNGLRPQIWIDDTLYVETPSVMAPGTRVSVVLGVYEPGLNEGIDRTANPFSYQISSDHPVGSVAAVGVEANQTSDRLLNALQSRVNAAVLDAQTAGLSHFGRVSASLDVLDGLAGTISIRNGISLGMAYGNPDHTKFDYNPELQVPIVPKSLFVDIPRNFLQSLSIDNLSTVNEMRDRIAGRNGSAQEHALWEEIVNTEGMSTIKSLQLANNRGIPVRTFNSTQWASTYKAEFTNASIPANEKLTPQLIAAIEAELGLGATVTSPSRLTDTIEWSGIGFIGERPNGNVAYAIVKADGTTGNGGYRASPPLQPTVIPPSALRYLAGDPINVANGAVVEDAVDISIPRVGLPLMFERHYDSSIVHDDVAADVHGRLGRNWFHSYSDYLTFATDGTYRITWTNDRGQQFIFTPNGDDSWTPPTTLRGDMRYVPNVGYYFRNRDGVTRWFNGSGMLTQISDANGNALQVLYNGGLIDRARHVGSQRDLVFSYQGSPANRTRITSITDFAGRTWTYSYNADGGLAQVTSPSNGQTAAMVTKYRYYDSTLDGGIYAGTRIEGKLKDIEAPDGGVVTHTYYPNGRGHQVVNPNGFTQTFHYDLYRQRTTFLDERGLPTVYGYDDFGYLIEKAYADGSTEKWMWDNGLQTQHTDVSGITQVFVYSTGTADDIKYGNVTQTYRTRVYGGAIHAMFDAQGTYVPTATEMTYVTIVDAAGNLLRSVMTKSTDPLGVETLYDHDANGNVVTIERANGTVNEAITRMTYNSDGTVATVTDPRGENQIAGDYVTAFTYDPLGSGQVDTTTRWISATEAAVTDSDYDVYGFLIRQADPRGGVTLYTNDLLGRRLKIFAPAVYANQPLTERTWTQTYYASGLPATSTDALGRSTTTTYDKLHHPLRSVLPDGSILDNVYDAVGNLQYQTDELGRLIQSRYDDRNRRHGTVHADGAFERVRYDALGRMVTQIDAMGRTTELKFDALGRLHERREPDPDGNTATIDAPIRKFQYDAVGNVVKVTNPRGFETTSVYDSLYRLKQRTDVNPDGNVNTNDSAVWGHSYDVNGNLIETIDPRGHKATYEFDGLNRQTIERRWERQADASFQQVTFAATGYDAAGNVTSSTDGRSHTTIYEFDARNRRIGMTQPDPDDGGLEQSPVWTYRHDAVGNLVETVDPRGSRSLATFDARNRLRQSEVRDAANVRLTESIRGYDPVGNLIVSTDALGHSGWSVYDVRDRQIATIDPTLATVTTMYDAVGNVLEATDPLGRKTRWTHDNLNRVTIEKMFDAGGVLQATTTHGYDQVGNLIWTVDPRGNVAGATASDFQTWFAYDGLNRQFVVALPPIAGVVHYLGTEYDAAGNVTATVDQLARRTTYQYDGLNRRTHVIQPEAVPGQTRTIETGYDAVGNVEFVDDALDHRTSHEYDNLNRRISTTDALLNVTQTRYDASGNVIQFTDPLGNETHYVFDGANRVIKERQKLADGSFDDRTFEFDAAGNQTTITDRNDRVREFSFDANNRLTRERWRDTAAGPAVNTITSGYNAAGELTTIEDAFSKYAWTYDYAGRMLSESNAGTPGMPAVTLAMTYDPAGYRDTLSVNGTLLIDYEHDARGRLVSLERPGVLAVDLAYTGDGQLSQVNRYGGVSGTTLVGQTGYVYDPATGRLSLIEHSSGSSTILSSYAYAYDRAARITSINSLLDGTATFTHDDANQLTVVAGARSESYTLDSGGNRTASHLHGAGYNSQTAGNHNRLTTDGTYNYAYDGEGNLTLRTHIASGAVTEYAYDYRNRLTGVVERAGLAGAALKQTTFVYDTLDRRIAKSHDADGAGAGSAVVEKYILDGSAILLQYNGADTLTHRYLNGEAIEQAFADEALLDPSQGGGQGATQCLLDSRWRVIICLGSEGRWL